MSYNSKNKSNKIQSVFLFSDNDKTFQEIMEDAFINMLKTVHTSKLLDNCPRYDIFI